MDSSRVLPSAQPLTGSISGNETLSTTGFVTFLLDDVRRSWGGYAAVAGAIVAFLLLHRLSTPRLEPGEPPLLKPRMPIIGHIAGVMSWQNDYVHEIFKRTPRDIATLPMGDTNMYVAWHPALMQAAIRNKHLDFGPFALDFTRKILGLDRDLFDLILRNENLIDESIEGMKVAMKGEPLRRMNTYALAYLSGRLDGLCPAGGVKVPNLFLWLRELMTMATTEALYGEANPFRDPRLVEALWDFESALPTFIFDLLPVVFARKAVAARTRLQGALAEYYSAGRERHESAASITKVRIEVLRRYGLTARQVGQLELSLTHVATANTIPTLYWLVSFIFSRPDLVEELREEAMAVIERSEDGLEARMDLSTLEKRCPLLVSCYRETIRLTNRNNSHRTVVKDSEISDGRGARFILKEGSQIQMAGASAHLRRDIWGDDHLSFNPTRFLPQKDATPEAERMRKAAYIPFGGGKHLCPGRNFAFAENLGFVVALLVGFEISDATARDRPIATLEANVAPVSAAIPKPAKQGRGQGAFVRRRPGWEHVHWKYDARSEKMEAQVE